METGRHFISSQVELAGEFIPAGNPGRRRGPVFVRHRSRRAVAGLFRAFSPCYNNAPNYALRLIEEVFLALAFRILFLLLLCTPALAQQRVDLYRADSLVPDQSQRERNQATVDALAEVIVRASGQPRVLQNPQVVDALGEASDYLVEWRYENSTEMLEVDGNERPAWRLVMRFSGGAIEKLLRDSRLPIWPANRPSMLVWLVVDSPQGRSRVSAGSFPEALKQVRDSAQRRGIPLVKSLMDLEDQVALPVDSLWSLDQEAIRDASERYNPDSILVGRLTETSGGQWRAGWLLLHRGTTASFDTSGADLDTLVAAGVDEVANHFFELYGIMPSEGSGAALVFQVDGVEDFASYSALRNYLDNLAVVRRYDLAAVRGGSMLLYLYLEGDTNLLRDALALDDRLVPQADLSLNSVPPGEAGNPLRYRWR